MNKNQTRIKKEARRVTSKIFALNEGEKAKPKSKVLKGLNAMV